MSLCARRFGSVPASRQTIRRSYATWGLPPWMWQSYFLTLNCASTSKLTLMTWKTSTRLLISCRPSSKYWSPPAIYGLLPVTNCRRVKIIFDFAKQPFSDAFNFVRQVMIGRRQALCGCVGKMGLHLLNIIFPVHGDILGAL